LRLSHQELVRDTESLATMLQTLFIMQEHCRMTLHVITRESGPFLP
jgi:hypothetical protein